jgi:hypothetical protein
MRGFAVRRKICRKYAILLHKKLQLTGVENKASSAHFLRKIIQYSKNYRMHTATLFKFHYWRSVREYVLEMYYTMYSR